MSGEVVQYVDPHNLPIEMHKPDLIPSEHELQVYQVIAKQAFDSKHYTKLAGAGGVAALVSIMLYAREVGVPAMTALSGAFHNIEGKIEASTALIAQKIREAGHRLEIQVSSDFECVIWGKRRDTGEELTVTMTMDMAKRAGWADKAIWKKHPDDMLFNRAISKLRRRLFPEVLSGAYASGEIQESIDQDPPRPSRQKPQPKPAASNEKVFPKEEPVESAAEPDTPPPVDEPATPGVSSEELSPDVAKKFKMAEAYLRGIKVDGEHYTEDKIDQAFTLLLRHFQVIDANDLTDEQLAGVLPFVKSAELRALLKGEVESDGN